MRPRRLGAVRRGRAQGGRRGGRLCRVDRHVEPGDSVGLGIANRRIREGDVGHPIRHRRARQQSERVSTVIGGKAGEHRCGQQPRPTTEEVQRFGSAVGNERIDPSVRASCAMSRTETNVLVHRAERSGGRDVDEVENVHASSGWIPGNGECGDDDVCAGSGRTRSVRGRHHQPIDWFARSRRCFRTTRSTDVATGLGSPASLNWARFRRRTPR